MTYQLNTAKLLIVEDMQPMLSLTMSILKIFGFKNVDGAHTVEAGYNLFRQKNHDLVITDWLMEPFDGLDLIRFIRKYDDSPNKFVPIILMTGYSDQTRVETARDMGVTEFLMKPYSARDLYMRIMQIVEKPRQFVDAGDFFGPDRRRRKNFDYLGLEKRGTLDKNKGGWVDSVDIDIDLVLHDLAEEAKKL
jgi:two-component system, chemotaxis family, chemotaxis protein CheY